MKKVILVGLMGGLLTSGLVKADQLIFSQFDGVNTWNNVYVEVDNASDYVIPGVGFAEAQSGSETQAVAGVKGVEGKLFRGTLKFKNTRTGLITKKRFKEKANGTFTVLRFVDGNRTHKHTGLTEGEAQGIETRTRDRVANWAHLSPIKDVVTQERVEAVAEVKEVKASWEQSLPARAIISVPTGVDMETFIADFMK